MLGLLHRVVLGVVPPQLRELFLFADPADPSRIPTRLGVRRHSRQFRVPEFQTDVLKRSVFGLLVVYNLLPQKVVDLQTVSAFQSHLQRALSMAITQQVEEWQGIFSPFARPIRAVFFQTLFV